MKDIWAIVLAAGESKRMGSPKMLLPYAGKTIIERVIGNVLASEIENVVTVLGSDSERILNVIKKLPIRHCYNPDYRDGMISSVRCGFEFLPDDFLAAMILLGDQPMTTPSLINRLLIAFGHSGKEIIVPAYNGKRGHPVVIGRKYREEIMNLGEPEGLRSLLKRHPDDLLELEAEDSSVLMDIDTKEEYLNEINKIKQTWKKRSCSD